MNKNNDSPKPKNTTTCIFFCALENGECRVFYINAPKSLKVERWHGHHSASISKNLANLGGVDVGGNQTVNVGSKGEQTTIHSKFMERISGAVNVLNRCDGIFYREYLLSVGLNMYCSLFHSPPFTVFEKLFENADDRNRFIKQGYDKMKKGDVTAINLY